MIRLDTEASKMQYLRDIKVRDYGYKYPEGLDLRPGSELHSKIVSEVSTRARDSYSIMSRRHEDWNKIDETLTTYITLDDEEELIKTQDIRKPVSIVVPFSYAVLDTLLTYMTMVFLVDPIFKYKGITSEDTVGAMMLEKVIQTQCNYSKVALSLHTQFRDSFAYGLGVSTPIWYDEYGYKTVYDTIGNKSREEHIIFEGNRLDNIDPYLYLPDPSAPINDPKKGGYVGWIDRTNYISLLDREAEDENIFNVQYLAGVDGRSCLLTGLGESGRETKFGGSAYGTSWTATSTPMDITYMYMKIIPKEWKLGKEEYPEKWMFAVGADSVVIMAQPLELDHNRYPVSICCPDYDGYSLSPIGRLETLQGLQSILDFLMNSHVKNVRKAINDMLIVDPYLVNMKDFEDPKAGKLIRMRRTAWGRGVKDAVSQLAVNDVTRNHMADTAVVIDMMQRASGSVDSLMGIMREGSERRSATESRATTQSALSRLARMAKICSIMTMRDIGYMFASHTQQLMTQEVYASIAGRNQTELEEEYGQSVGMKISPFDINVNYDIDVGDGSIESGEFADNWTMLYQILATNPAVGSGFDMARIFKHIARLSGAKNVNDFVAKGGAVNIRTMQNAQVQAEIQKGNMKPVGGNVDEIY